MVEATEASQDFPKYRYQIELLIQRPSKQHKKAEKELLDKKGINFPFHMTGHAVVNFVEHEDGRQVMSQCFGFGHTTSNLKAILFPFVGGHVERKIFPDYYNDKIIYPVSKEQYEKGLAFVNYAKYEKTPKYSVLVYNCVDFAYDALKVMGLKPPTKMLISTPRFAARKIKKLESIFKLTKSRLDKNQTKLANFFAKDKDAPLESNKNNSDEVILPFLVVFESRNFS